jgi:hypothetical protein
MRPEFVPVVGREEFSPREWEDLVRYGLALAALDAGTRRPTDPQQEHFVLVCRGKVEPKWPYETLWLKYRALAAKKPRNADRPPVLRVGPPGPKRTRVKPGRRAGKWREPSSLPSSEGNSDFGEHVIAGGRSVPVRDQDRRSDLDGAAQSEEEGWPYSD